MTHITTLIPAYKKEYLAPLFLALRRQSFKDFRVILSDDSPGGVITDMLRGGHFAQLTAGLNLLVVRGPQNARRNHEQLLDLWAGETPLLHFNLDDDIIFPDFYKQHVAAHAAAPCCVSVSQRWLSHDDGVPAWSLPIPDLVTDCDGHVMQLSAEEVFGSTVANCENWLGELSNMVLSAEGAAFYPRPPVDELTYYGLLDIGFVLNASQHLPVTFIRESLSVFRQNEQQTTHNTHSHGGRVGFLAWVAYALSGWRDGHLSPEQTISAIGIATKRVVHHFSDDPVVAEYFQILDTQAQSLDSLYVAFRGFWLRLLATHPGTSPSAQQRSQMAAAASASAPLQPDELPAEPVFAEAENGTPATVATH